VRCLCPPRSGGGGAPTGAHPASLPAARPPFPVVDDGERWRHPGPPLASPVATPSPDSSSSTAHAGANCRETMREGKRSTAAGSAPLRDVVVCIRLVFADALRQAAGDSLIIQGPSGIFILIRSLQTSNPRFGSSIRWPPPCKCPVCIAPPLNVLFALGTEYN
jgi:hypothetical protein